MKKIFGAAVLAGAGVIAATSAANAGEISGNVALTSDYQFRGLTQSDGELAVQGGFDYSSGIFYAGVWASSVNFGATGTTETVSVETDLYAGITPRTGPITWDLGIIGYFYPNADDEVVGGNELDFFEAKIGASMDVTSQFRLGAAVYYSPDFVAESGDATYIEVNGAYAINDAFKVSGAYGAQDSDFTGDYNTWNLGVTHAMHGFEIDLRYHDTDITGVDESVNLTLSRSL